jgi:ketosteroid isomerase-like protein
MQHLIDKDAIRDLVLLYSRGVDRQDFALLRSLYTQDAVEDNHSGLFTGSAEAYVDWLETSLPRVATTTHAVQNHLIVVEDETHAQGEVYVLAYHRLPAEGGGWFDQIHGSRYLDHYEKQDGRWLFARRSVAIDWKRRGPSSWDSDHPDVPGMPLGTHDAADPSYHVLGNVHFARHG